MRAALAVFATPWAVIIGIAGLVAVRAFVQRRRRQRQIDVGFVSSAWLTANSIDPREQHR